MHHTYMRECLWSWGCVGEEGVGWMVVIRDRLLSMEKRWREMRFWVWSLLLASFCIVEVHIYPRSEIDSKYRFPLKGLSSFPSIFVCMQYHMPNCIARCSYPSLCSIITYPILFFHQTPWTAVKLLAIPESHCGDTSPIACCSPLLILSRLLGKYVCNPSLLFKNVPVFSNLFTSLATIHGGSSRLPGCMR